MTATAAPSISRARQFLTALTALGVRELVLCPGSRSGPLAYAALALQRAGLLQVQVRTDERSAAFLALGAAKAAAALGEARPVAVVTTSGTAAANLHPAILEAHHAGVPLIAITADRPHELRGVGANQTANQVNLFGDAARYWVDLPAADQAGDGRWERNIAARAVAAASGFGGGGAGPVHVNIAFRDPLVPESGDGDAWVTAERAAAAAGGSGLTKVASGAADAHPTYDLDDSQARTVVIAGDGAGFVARNVAEAGNWPLFAEPSSGARGGPCAIGPYRLLLGGDLAQSIQRVIIFGHATLSRPIQQLLARSDIELIVVDAGAGARADWPDVGRRAAVVTPAVALPKRAGDADWLQQWQRAGERAREAVTAELTALGLCGPLVAREVAATVQAQEVLWAGSSNAVRDLDLAAEPWAGPHIPTVLAHRGLAGIDGTISAAIGAAWATEKVTRALIGDLTFLHDIGALALDPANARCDVQLVVIDDNGGGIFATLEGGDGRHATDFERAFGTPHNLNLAAVAAAFGWSVSEATDRESLVAALAKHGPGAGPSIVIVPVDRADRRAQAARLATALAT